MNINLKRHYNSGMSLPITRQMEAKTHATTETTTWSQLQTNPK